MLTEIIASLHITMPVFLLMMLGVLFRRTGIIQDRFAKDLNSFVFKIALPVSIFQQLYLADFRDIWDLRFVLFCFIATAAQILLSYGLAVVLCKKGGDKGEFTQACYRSSTALLGVTYLQQAYGTASASALMMVGCVPLYNVAAILLLMQKENGEKVEKRALVKSILTNPIILSIIIGFFFSALRIPLPLIGEKTVSSVAAIASPAGLMAMGASINFKRLGSQKWLILISSACKLMVFVAMAIPVAVHMGFTGEKLMAILIMMGSATTVASFTMAKSMGHDGELTAGTVMLTTLATSVTLTFWIFLLRHQGLL